MLVSNNSICLFELTNTPQHLLAARALKEDQYGCQSLQYDLQLSGLSVNLISIKIGCLDHFMPDTIAQVANTCAVTKKTIRPTIVNCLLPVLVGKKYHAGRRLLFIILLKSIIEYQGYYREPNQPINS